jgi:hypothetical protein
VKITFEGIYFSDIVEQMRAMVAGLTPPKINSQSVSEKANKSAIPSAAPASEPQGPGPEDLFGGDNPVDKPVDKTSALTPGQQQAAKMRAAKEAKAKEREEAAAAAAEKAKAEKAAMRAAVKAKIDDVPPKKKEKEKEEEEKAVDPAEAVKIRQKTIADLQAAYANGFQKEVFDLLSKFGNGAKSFRELPADAFGPIRAAIDAGALTQ